MGKPDFVTAITEAALGVYLDGVKEGRRQAAADIRAEAAKYTGVQYRSFRMCVRLAERGTCDG